MAKMQEIARTMGLDCISSLQPQYSLLARGIESEQLAFCREEGLAVLPWSPLCGGWLSGRYRRGMTEPPSGSRVAWAEGAGWKQTDFSTRDNETTWGTIDKLVDIAEAHGRSVAQTALRWVMQRPGITAPIIGAKRMAHLEDNCGWRGF